MQNDSSGESDGESPDLVQNALSVYCSELGRDKPDFTDYLKTLNNTSCLICLGGIKKLQAVWSCELCYTIFHLVCIQQWAKDGVSVKWTCPKCRVEYDQPAIPTVYHCFCGKQVNPQPDPWLLPHTCGKICGRDLKSNCGHKCLCLCHSGPCPPCPKTVVLSCYCGQGPSKAQRCGFTGWSCGGICKRILSCGLHTCEQVCHKGSCLPCSEQVLQNCVCGKEARWQPCDQTKWFCEQVCGKPLKCKHHFCERKCHSGVCGDCPRQGKRTCPCGKKEYILDCTVQVPSCGDTCSKLLDCGRHRCVRLCHMGDCGSCLQSVEKHCRCGQKKKSVLCSQDFLCDSRCQRIRQCGRHQCRKKCCVGNCPPCEQLCGRLLPCKTHKCSSPCHSGQCYPCVLNVLVSCACGKTSTSVLCGRQRTTKPPQCNQLCQVLPACHHPRSAPHYCHFGECPPCKQICSLPLPCKHLCTALCHSIPTTSTEDKPVAPWKKLDPVLVVRPCPPCKHKVSRACYGGHEVKQFLCSEVTDYSCSRLCGCILKCGNHTCSKGCHRVINAVDATSAGENCSTCEELCNKSRHPECKHLCPLFCHSGSCPPCESTVKLSCHCFSISVYVKCSEWCVADIEVKDIMRSCNSPCSKMLSCGHRCIKLCHSGPCSPTSQCIRRVTVRCPCRRLKKDWRCNEQQPLVCNEDCLSIKVQEEQARTTTANREAALKDKEEREAIAVIERQLRPRKRKRKTIEVNNAVQDNTYKRKLCFVVGILILLLGLMIKFMQQ